LAIIERQAEASAANVSEPLNVISDRFVIPLPDGGQVYKLHLVYSCEEVLMELLFQIGPCNEEFAGKEENKAKADPDSDSGNRRIFKASTADGSPHWIRKWLMCSTVVMPSCPENLVKSSTL